MASNLSSHLTCPVCLCLFNDPTVLPCEHTFCRLCILSYLESGATRCPECRQTFSKQDLKGNRALRNLVEDVQQEQKTNEVKKQQQNARNAHAMLCSEHEEPLKLFCEDDQKLVCLICREGEKHSGHSFKPVKEAMEPYENVAIQALSFIHDENKQVGEMIFRQMNEITKSKERGNNLEERIHAQFKKMHDFLREKEEIMTKQLQRASDSAEAIMKQNASLLGGLQINGNQVMSCLESGLKVTQPERFLQWWSEEGSCVVKEITATDNKDITPFLQAQFRSRLYGNRVISDHFTIGPYESYLPMIVCRDMLDSVKQDLNTSIIDEDMKLSIRKDSHPQLDGQEYFARILPFYSGNRNSNVEDKQTWLYWEVAIGAEPGWENGLTVKYYPKQKNASFLKTFSLVTHKSFEKLALLVKHNKLYAVRGDEETLLVNQVVPRRVGVYIDCEKRQVVYCNADNMSLIHTMWCGDK
ncbi:nuclear factor 7, ovary [Triplophysa rosa]|uniref:Zinc-binding protein A33-like n=1 Tax=Triplophysa rosa TaxID=992332 RepID=A0A9W8C3K3_TRIRA|nr:nuclear factor 7, ovary [Triplophysa rosa]KAI7806458.1 putative zinc-binding protein A33-like [Triplophysa rosa]